MFFEKYANILAAEVFRAGIDKGFNCGKILAKGQALFRHAIIGLGISLTGNRQGLFPQAVMFVYWMALV